MPEVSLMQPLCDALKINLNELFSGEQLNDSNYKKKAEENIIHLAKESENFKKNIVGGEVFGVAQNIDKDISSIHKTNNEFWSTVGNDVLGATALPSYGGYATEEKLNLLGDLSNKKVLDVGCGKGHSLKYVYERGAEELWGIDISKEQIYHTKSYLASHNIYANLICSPMENKCNIPLNYFDLIYSILGIGWSTNLDTTFKLINSYLKSNGIFIFNWSHPIHKCTSVEGSNLVFSNSYYDESWYCATIENKEIMLSNRMLSTFINTLADNGFMIEKLIETNDEKLIENDNSVFSNKAKMIPVNFVIKARKLV